MSDTSVVARSLVDLRDRTIQKARIQFSNRISAIDRGDDQSEYREVLEKYLEKFAELEDDLDHTLKDIADDMPIVEHMTRVKGVGKTLAVKAASMIDISRASSVSALWRYAGYGVVDGEREKPTKGEKLHYNIRLKATCYLIGSSFLKCNSPYRQVYDSAKAYYEANRPDWTKARRHNAAMRKMIKIWLSHLWMVWRKMEGLDTRAPYANNHLGHVHVYMPDEFGWGDE